MRMIEKKMDLFDLPNEYTLVHCISQDCAMGAGIAKTFNQKYPDMKPGLIKTLNANKLKYPKSLLYHEISEKHDVINMITKEKYWHKPTYDTFRDTLLDVVLLCKKNGIKKLGMPYIGCGLDKLKWNIVKSIIEKEFTNLNVEIIVCYL